MSGSGWCSQQLNVDEVYLSMMYLLMVGRCSSVGATGSTDDCEGGSAMGKDLNSIRTDKKHKKLF